MTVPDNTLANRRSDSEIGTAIILITLIGIQSGSHGGSGEQSSLQINPALRFFIFVMWIKKNVMSASASVVP